MQQRQRRPPVPCFRRCDRQSKGDMPNFIRSGRHVWTRESMLDSASALFLSPYYCLFFSPCLSLAVAGCASSCVAVTAASIDDCPNFGSKGKRAAVGLVRWAAQRLLASEDKKAAKCTRGSYPSEKVSEISDNRERENRHTCTYGSASIVCGIYRPDLLPYTSLCNCTTCMRKMREQKM